MSWSISVYERSKSQVLIETAMQISKQKDHVPHGLYAMVERYVMSLGAVPESHYIQIWGSGHHDAFQAEIDLTVYIVEPIKEKEETHVVTQQEDSGEVAVA